jgi:hypothetical protein
VETLCGEEESLKSQFPILLTISGHYTSTFEKVYAAPCENQTEEAGEGRSGCQVLELERRARTQRDAAGERVHTQVETHIALAVAGAIDNDDGAETCARGDDHQCRRQPLFRFLWFRFVGRRADSHWAAKMNKSQKDACTAHQGQPAGPRAASPRATPDGAWVAAGAPAAYSSALALLFVLHQPRRARASLSRKSPHARESTQQ